jgi:hypothetical protein
MKPLRDGVADDVVDVVVSAWCVVGAVIVAWMLDVNAEVICCLL